MPQMSQDLPLSDDLHRAVWFAYRHAIGTDASWNAHAAFQVAVDIFLRERPGADARSACCEAARMVMTRPRGIGVGGRKVMPIARTMREPFSPRAPDRRRP